MHNLPRTLTYSQALIGAGTSDVEGLRSYVQRLAAAHNMPALDLFSALTGHRLGNHRLRQGFSYGARFNQELVAQLVGEATGVPLGQSTVARFHHLLSRQSLVRSLPTDWLYCPLCVRSPADLTQRHGRLLWDLAPVRACPTHAICLERVCNCGAAKDLWLPLYQRPSLPYACSVCGSIGYECHPAIRSADDGSVWVAAELGELLALDEKVVREIRPEQLRHGIAQVVRYAFGDQPVRAARDSGLARASVFTWLQGGARPSIGSLLQFAFAAQASLKDILLGSFVHCPRSFGARSSTVFSKRRYRQIDWDVVLVELAKSLDQPNTSESPSSFATRMSVDRCALRRRYPQQYDALRKKHEASAAEKLQSGYQTARLAFAEAAAALVADGKSVTTNRVQEAAGIWIFSKRTETRRGIALQEVLSGAGKSQTQARKRSGMNGRAAALQPDGAGDDTEHSEPKERRPPQGYRETS